MKILLIEDSATLRHTMCRFIRRAGHEPVVAESGEEALQLVETLVIDLIIMDVEMPGLDGFETTVLIREFFGERWVPIVFLTGMSDEASYRKGIESGGDDYMIKPVSPVILEAKLRAFERIVEMRAQLEQLNEELKTLSQRDGLTGLFNRRAYEEKAAQQWKLATRNYQPMAILMVDVDHFKGFNDHYGHLTGDECLKRVAEVLSCGHRTTDFVGRYGGEEFIVMLPNTDYRGARLVGESLRKAVQELAIPNASATTDKVVTVSVGGAVAEDCKQLTDMELAGVADKALYRAKSQGRNRVEVDLFAPHEMGLIADEH